MNLIICSTPLQMLLAESIIDLHPNEKFYGIVFFSSQNEKFMYYSNKLEKKCSKFEVFYLRGGLNFFFNLFINRFYFKNKIFDKVFIASIDSIFIHTILTSISFRDLFTFDDGTANIFKNSPYYVPKKDNFKIRVSRLVLAIRINLEWIIKRSCLHYTIYPYENIIKNTIKINIFNTFNDVIKDRININRRKNIKICLGQPLYSSNKDNEILFFNIMKNKSIDFYFPHPREHYNIPNVKYINTKLIFEDYIKSIYQSYDCIEIYTICSSAALNISDDKIKIYCIYLEDFKEELSLMESFGLEVINL